MDRLINMIAIAVPFFTLNVYDRVIPNNATETLWSLAIGVILLLGVDFGLRMAMSRRIGARPQLVQGNRRAAGTNRSAWPIVSATCSAVSTSSLATSITPTITSLPSSR